MGKFNLQIDGKNKSTTEGNSDWWYGGGNDAWQSLQDAKSGVPLAIRKGKTVGVLEDGKIVEYIWHPEDLSNSGLVVKNPIKEEYGYFQLQTNSVNRKQIASQNILNFLNGDGIAITYEANGGVRIKNTITNNNQLENGAGYVTSSGNTIIGTSEDVIAEGSNVISKLTLTDGVITSHEVRVLTLGNLGYTGDLDANRITNNNQLTNGAGYITSYVNTQLTKEQVEDFVGGMVSGNNEQNISVVYDDVNGKLNFIAENTQLSDADVIAIIDPLFARLDGGNTFTGNQTIDGDIDILGVLNLRYGSGVVGSATGNANQSFLDFNEVDGQTRQGVIGFESPNNSDFHIANLVSGKRLSLQDDGVLDYDGNATFGGSVSINDKLKLRDDGAIDFGLNMDYGRLTWSINKAILKGLSGKALYLGANNNSDDLIIDTSGNATFGGDVTINSNSLALKGSGAPAISVTDLDGTNQFGTFGHNGGSTTITSRNGNSNGIFAYFGYDGSAFTNFFNIAADGKANFTRNLGVQGNATFKGDVEVDGQLTGNSGVLARSQSGDIGLLVERGANLYYQILHDSNGTIIKNGDNDIKYRYGSSNTAKMTFHNDGGATFGGDVDVSGNATFRKYVSIIGNSNAWTIQNAENNTYLNFRDATGSSSVFRLDKDEINAYKTFKINAELITNTNATFGGDIIQTGAKVIKNLDEDLYLQSPSGKNIYFRIGGSNVALTLDSNKNATFGGDVILKGSRLGFENASVTNSAYIENIGGSGVSVLNIADALSIVEGGNATFGGDEVRIDNGEKRLLFRTTDGKNQILSLDTGATSWQKLYFEASVFEFARGNAIFAGQIYTSGKITYTTSGSGSDGLTLKTTDDQGLGNNAPFIRFENSNNNYRFRLGNSGDLEFFNTATQRVVSFKQDGGSTFGGEVKSNATLTEIASDDKNLITKEYADANYGGGLPSGYYDEGTFTPILSGGNNTNAFTYNVQANYVRTGNVVTISMIFEDIKGANNQQIKIMNIPFKVIDFTTTLNTYIKGNDVSGTYADFESPCAEFFVTGNNDSDIQLFENVFGSYPIRVGFAEERGGVIKVSGSFITDVYTP